MVKIILTNQFYSCYCPPRSIYRQGKKIEKILLDFKSVLACNKHIKMIDLKLGQRVNNELGKSYKDISMYLVNHIKISACTW